jgi:hypothetical protein
MSQLTVRGGKMVKGFFLVGLCLAMMVGCASTNLTEEEKEDVRRFRKGSEEERLEIARKYDAEEDLKQWEGQIKAKQIAKGMPRGAVLMAWGMPRLTEESEDGRTEKWFYRRVYEYSYTLYFKDGKLESWYRRKYQKADGGR